MERNTFKIRKQTEVSKDDYEWFIKEHPGASLSWIVNILLQHYRKVCTENKSPSELVHEAVIESIEEVTTVK